MVKYQNAKILLEVLTVMIFKLRKGKALIEQCKLKAHVYRDM